MTFQKFTPNTPIGPKHREETVLDFTRSTFMQSLKQVNINGVGKEQKFGPDKNATQPLSIKSPHLGLIGVSCEVLYGC